VRVVEQAQAWLATAAWIALVLWLSSDQFSYTQTGGLFSQLMAILMPDLDQAELKLLHGFLRKTAHLVEYGVLGLLAVRALLPTVPLRRSALWALLLAVTVALVDEGYQATSAVRTGHPKDVLIDTCGACLGIAGGLWRSKVRP
jgi:VanZ family protein